MNGIATPSSASLQADAGVGKGTGIDDDAADTVRTRLMNGFDQLVLRVALHESDLACPRRLSLSLQDGR